MTASLKLSGGGSWMKPVIKIGNHSSKTQCKYGQMGPDLETGAWGFARAQ